MKTASTIFTVIGMVANLGVAITYSYMMPRICFVFWILAALCWIFGISAIASKKKNISLGIAMIFFVNVLSGVFYLCWNGEE